jgi:hypothetical protein
MLTLSDVKGIARNRFFLGGVWKHEECILNILSIWALIMMIAIVIFAFCGVSNAPYVKYVIPWSVVEQGKDITVMSQVHTGDTVNGYILHSVGSSTASDDYKLAWFWVIAIQLGLSVIGMVVYTSMREHYLGKYIDKFAEKWADNKELPER